MLRWQYWILWWIVFLFSFLPLKYFPVNNKRLVHAFRYFSLFMHWIINRWKSFIDKGFCKILIFIILDEYRGHVDCLSVPIFLSQDKTTAMAKTIYIGILMVMIGSCISTKNIGYFNNASETEYTSTSGAETAIQANDILSISISSLNPEASAIFNTTNGQSNSCC